AHGGQAPRILHLVVERDAVVGQRQRRSVSGADHGAREILLQRLLIVAAPLRKPGRQSPLRKGNRVEEETRIDATAAVEAMLGIDLVEVVNDASDLDALVLVE